MANNNAGEWTHADFRTFSLANLAFPLGTVDRDQLILRFFPQEKHGGAMFLLGIEDFHEEDNAPPLLNQPNGANIGAWSQAEKVMFIRGVNTLGRQWTLISEQFVPSRTPLQVQGHSRNISYRFFLQHY